MALGARSPGPHPPGGPPPWVQVGARKQNSLEPHNLGMTLTGTGALETGAQRNEAAKASGGRGGEQQAAGGFTLGVLSGLPRRHAVGGLVWLQRRLSPGRQRGRGHGHRCHPGGGLVRGWGLCRGGTAVTA
jgi:hypothetical protein